LDQAEKYAEVAHKVDSYNPGALVNLGNVCFVKGDVEKAREHYLEAVDCDASSVEAIYNLGEFICIFFPES
jgi:intraflagellar transport protein 88